VIQLRKVLSSLTKIYGDCNMDNRVVALTGSETKFSQDGQVL